MKKRPFLFLLNTLIISSFLLFITSCNDDDKNISEGQQVYFQYNYVNYAWERYLDGFIIDETGAVRTFKEDPLKWNFPSEEGYISAEKMTENINKTKASSVQMPKETLNNYIQKAYFIDNDNYTKETSVGADIGLYIYACYKFDPKKNQYKFILLDQKGDSERTNKDPNAISILEWMKTIKVLSIK